MLRVLLQTVPALAAILLFGAGCTPKALPRWLPDQVHNVYVPIFETHAYEPGLEENLTRHTIDEFLLDGRVNVTSSRQADLVLSGFLDTYETFAEELNDDEFVLITTLRATARMTAFGPDDANHENPLFIWDGIEAEIAYVSDKRFAIDTLDVDARDLLMEALAREVVVAVMERAPDWSFEDNQPLEPRLLDTSPRFRPAESLRERRIRQRGLPPLKRAF